MSIARVYICGCYTAPCSWQRQRNIFAARLTASDVVRLGAYPVTPHANLADFESLQSQEWFYEATLADMRTCDAVLTVPGWEASVGARGEVAEARRLGIPVFETIDELRAWLVPPGAEAAQ